MAAIPRNGLLEEEVGDAVGSVKFSSVHRNIRLKTAKKVQKRKLKRVSILWAVDIWLLSLFIGGICESKVCRLPAHEVNERLSSSPI